eukprot:2757244-Amphidinium_carterae.1
MSTICRAGLGIDDDAVDPDGSLVGKLNATGKDLVVCSLLRNLSLANALASFRHILYGHLARGVHLPPAKSACCGHPGRLTWLNSLMTSGTLVTNTVIFNAGT